MRRCVKEEDCGLRIADCKMTYLSYVELTLTITDVLIRQTARRPGAFKYPLPGGCAVALSTRNAAVSFDYFLLFE
jgi:hypothetical protein